MTSEQVIEYNQQVMLRQVERLQSKLEAVKHDSGTDKPPMGLIPQASLKEVAKVLEFGAKKYARHNWRLGMDYSRLYDAAYRHIGAFIEGEDTDPETGLSHIAHATCCMLFLLEYTIKGSGTDDRYKKEMP